MPICATVSAHTATTQAKQLNLGHTILFKINVKSIVNSATLLFWDDGKAGFKYRKTILTCIIYYSILYTVYCNNCTTNATIIYKHVVILLYVTAFFGHPQGGVNLSNPTGYVMHHHFNIQQLYALPTLYLCVWYLYEEKQRFVPLTSQTDWFL